MFNPLEMFQAQGEAGLQAMGQPFGLTAEQTARAFEALMPALTLGLQRSVGMDPTGFARMFGLEAAKPAPAQGFEALGQMFGSAQLMQAVLRQASATSGVGAQVLRQMLPMMAGAVVASIVHVMLNQPQAEAARPSPPPPPVPFPFAPAWAEMARAMMPAVEPPAPPKPAARPAAKPPQAGAGEAGSDMFQQMLRTGAEVQGNNIRAMQELFETFWPASGTPAGSGMNPTGTPTRPDPAPADPAAGKGRRGRQPGGTG
ncbi:hypothetical protein SAMN02799622_01434 [Methylobacterium sp. UNC378MF]|jgi:hypothetical protein|uniref:DUF937 domain-containing protein n=1 Tax=Methylobacterium sp. UNC378MF TaxID=1502748 RepID=UPI00088F123E|nr:DUF937 domain-containing protein [Methylobacterium sp. UNC378MF]SDA15895.1 hypothetical protein SAMN02799622_01434 [Methylobacterium sp. UNC378MF]